MSECCSDDDVIPNLNELITEIKSLSNNDMLVVPLGEYLRLFENRRGILRELATLEKSDGLNDGTKCRVYIPLFEVENIFFEQMKGVSRFGVPGECAKYYCIKSNEENTKVSLRIVSQNINEVVLGSDEVVHGLRQYMQIWEKTARECPVLSTGFAQWIKETTGNYSINVYKSSFELLMDYVDGCSELKEEWGNDEQWSWLLSQAKRGEHLNSLFSRAFNFAAFNAKSLFASWQDYDSNQKWLAWIWCKLEQHHGYMKYVVKNNNNFTSLQEDVINSIFDVREHDQELEQAMLKERKQLFEYMGIQNIPKSFWEKFNLINDNVKKLKCLSCVTNEEKSTAIKIVKELLDSKIDEEKWYDYLSIIYPELSYYMCVSNYNSPIVYEYFYNYIRSKLVDKVTDTMIKLVQDVANKEIWKFHSRNSLLQNYSECMFYWVDGMGAEWLGLIEGILRNEFPDIEYEYIIARANLPTTTEFNRGWEDTSNYMEYKGYDSFVHDYTCRYPRYIVEEFRHIRKIVRNAVNLLDDHTSVIITADHGTSRLAAISKQPSISLPPQIKVEKHGRYCVNDGSLDVNNYAECIEKDNKLIFATYGRFSIGGYVAGEIHGGATLEEVLVPVIIIRKKSKEDVVISFNLDSTSIRLNAKNEAILNFTLSGHVKKLTLVIRSLRFEAQYNDDKWQIMLKNMKPGRYKGTLWADNRNIGDVTFELTKGITIDDMGL